MKLNCKQCHGKGFFMEDDLVGNYTEFECDCEPDYDDEVEEDE